MCPVRGNTAGHEENGDDFCRKRASLLDILMKKYQSAPDNRFLPDYAKVSWGPL